MSFILTTILDPRWSGFKQSKSNIQLQMNSAACSPAAIVDRLASVKGQLSIYCWYEGPRFLPKSGAEFMTKDLYAPLYALKKDTVFLLYSLHAWSFVNDISKVPSSTPIGNAINRINQTVVQCISSTAFFQWCRQKNALCNFWDKELPQKEWLFKLSENQKEKGLKVCALFNNQWSLFDFIKQLDVSKAYSLMQYVVGYFLIQDAIRRGLLNGQKKIDIAFVLPKGEEKYYLDLPNDIEKMLQLDFGEKLRGIEINISFHFFKYGDDDAFEPRPYLDKGAKVRATQIESYFQFISKNKQGL